MIVKITSLLFATLFLSTAVRASIDCSEAYTETARCERIQCDEKYQSFLGTWSGPMEELISFEATPVYRAYQNKITYDSADCLRNQENGETFIVGRQTDTYPKAHGLEPKTETKLLVTGKDKNDNPFLRTINLTTKKMESWQLVYKNDVAALSIWQIQGIQDGNSYTIETIDAQDWTVGNPAAEHRRNVTVTLDAGGFKRVLIRGYHTKQ